MDLNFGFFIVNSLLGVGLAMDAFSVSVANGLNEPCMKKGKMLGIAGMFAFFQTLMPMIGWFFVYIAKEAFESFNKFIPWIALILLCYIGGKMIWDSLKCEENTECEKGGLGFIALVTQGIGTSIDALSVGFTFNNPDNSYTFLPALIASLLIGVLTFFICFGGIIIGKTVGSRLCGKAGIFGGVVLIAIGLEIFISGLIG